MNNIKMKKRNTLSTKAILIIGIILIAAITITTLVIGVFALNQHSFTGAIKILYTSEDIDGTASVSYQLLSEDGLSDGEIVDLGTITFNAEAEINPTQDLSPTETLNLSKTTPYVEFTYTFTNTGSLDYIATLSFLNVIQDENIGFNYKYKNYEYGTENFAILVQGIETGTEKSQATYRVKMGVEDFAKNATWDGMFNWELKSFETESTEEKLSVRSMDYAENGNGTYTASYSGGTLENNTLVISGNIGGVKVTSVGQIRNLPNNAKVVIGEGITTIESSAFSNQSVSDVELPDSLESIGGSSFYVCKFTSITIPKSVTSIGEAAFAYCSILQEFIVEDGNPVYSTEGNCLIENGTTLIAGCQNSVIPNYITHIAYRAFMGQTRLTTIHIPKSVQTMDIRGVFDYCYNLESFTAEAGGTFVVDGNCLIKDTELYAGCKNSTIPNYVTKINENAFAGITTLTGHFVIPNSVIDIYSYAFAGTGITSITFGTGLEMIGSGAFQNVKITTLTIPANVEYIGHTSFYDCKSLTEIYVLSTNENLRVHYGAFNNVTAKFYCCLSGPGVNWHANWQNSLTEINWNYNP